MAWTTPRTWVNGDIVTASAMNGELRDQMEVINNLLDLVSGSFTSGAILVGNDVASIQVRTLEIQGRLLVGGETAEPDIASIGATGQLLMADSGSSVGVTWNNNYIDLIEAQMFGSGIELF